MKILVVNKSDIQGGAARAAYRLHSALLNEGVNSHMLVQYKVSDDYTVTGPSGKIAKAISRMRPTLNALPLKRYPDRTQTLFSPAWLPFGGMAAKINAMNPDVVHLHWICGGMFTIKELAAIKAPIVWSLHDMWAFTGGCHYDESCGRFSQSCGKCAVLSTRQPDDISAKIWKKKHRVFGAINNMAIVGLSMWLAEAASESSLFKDKRVVNLPNPICTKTFSPLGKMKAKALLHLPQDKKLILFGAMKATGDSRKGFYELSAALNSLNHDSSELLVFGSSTPQKPPAFKQKVHYLGQLHDDLTLRILYSAADVMVVPSLQENLSNAIMESLACGTPVVAFHVGGNSDMISHGQNGYLAKPFDTKDLAAGIDWVLDNPDYASLCANARQKVLDCFDSHLVANQYISLYKEVLSESSRG